MLTTWGTALLVGNRPKVPRLGLDPGRTRPADRALLTLDVWCQKDENRV